MSRLERSVKTMVVGGASYGCQYWSIIVCFFAFREAVMRTQVMVVVLSCLLCACASIQERSVKVDEKIMSK